jgi:hypothetical protein
VKWFFTSKDSVVVKKNSKNISTQAILEAFTRKPQKSSVAGVFMYDDDQGKSVITIYITTEKIKNFIEDPKQRPSTSGVL